jgi:protein TonB
MFEQASLDSQGALKNPWAFTVSVAGQTVVITAAVMISLIHTDALPRSGLFTKIVAPGVSKVSPPPPTGAQPRSASTTPRVFRIPASVPTGIARELPGAPPSLSTGDIGNDLQIIGAIDGPGSSSMDRILTDAFRHVAPFHKADPPPTAKPVTATPATPISVSKGVQAAKILRQVNPVYPTLARQARISGTVRLVAIIGRDGVIQNLQVTSGHPLLTPAAVEAVKQWLYRPTLLSGEPVEVITQIDVNFTLSQ